MIWRLPQDSCASQLEAAYAVAACAPRGGVPKALLDDVEECVAALLERDRATPGLIQELLRPVVRFGTAGTVAAVAARCDATYSAARGRALMQALVARAGHKGRYPADTPAILRVLLDAGLVRANEPIQDALQQPPGAQPLLVMPLLAMAATGHATATGVLLSHGAQLLHERIRLPEPNPLRYLIEAGADDALRLLLLRGAAAPSLAVELTQRPDFPISLAARSGRVGALEALLQLGAPCARSFTPIVGFTPVPLPVLYEAACGAHPAVVKRVIAECRARGLPLEGDPLQPPLAAAMADLYGTAGPNVPARDERTPAKRFAAAVECAQLLLDAGAPATWNALASAAVIRHEGLVCALIARGAERAAPDGNYTALHLAIARPDGAGAARPALPRPPVRPVLSLLLEGLTPAEVDARDAREGKTALFLAVKDGDMEACELLLAAGASLDVSDAAGATPREALRGVAAGSTEADEATAARAAQLLAANPPRGATAAAAVSDSD